MNMELLRIQGPITFEIDGLFSLSTPKVSDLHTILQIISLNDSDPRGFEITSQASFTTRGKDVLEQCWESDLTAIRSHVSPEIFDQIEKQSIGILSSTYLFKIPTEIHDPFEMAVAERSASLDELRFVHLQNSIVARDNSGKVIGIGRVLDVGGCIEMVSLAVEEAYRSQGIGRALIQERLKRAIKWPMYSFVRVAAESKPGSSLIAYYMHQYADYSPSIPPFETLPPRLQQDLARMNDFWGSYIIIRIAGK